MRFEKTWDVNWNGHQILVRNWWNLFLQSGDQILIDGRLLDEKKARGLVASRELGGTVRTGGTVYAVRAYMGQIKDGWRVGCHISVDGKVIGGDLNHALAVRQKPQMTVSDAKKLLVLIAVVAISMGTFDFYDVEWYGFLGVMKYLVLAGTIGYFLCAQYYGWGHDERTAIGRLAWRIVPGVVLSCLLAGYVVLINANIGPQQAITVSGTVVDKIEWPGRRKPRYYLVVKGSDDLWRIRVDEPTFEQARLDAAFKQAWWSKGSLGIVYR